jgi:regulatory protein
MTIASLHIRTRPHPRVSVFVDGNYSFSLSLTLSTSLGLKVGKVLTAQELDALHTAATLDDAKTAIYAALSRRAHSRKELSQKLQRKGFPKDIIDLALAQAEQQGFINDQAFAQSFIKKRLRHTPLGLRKLQVELHQKGVSPRTAKQALTHADLQADTLCRAAAEKKWKSLQKEPDAQKRRRKLFAFLLRRGFEWDTIARVTASLW